MVGDVDENDLASARGPELQGLTAMLKTRKNFSLRYTVKSTQPENLQEEGNDFIYIYIYIYIYI